MSVIKKKLTYISLFSSAGVGCYGFKAEGFECIATNELIERRLAVQKANKKCKYDSGYISGDISLPQVKESLMNEILMWRQKENIHDIDVLISTPPCQGISLANHKKKADEIVRNSLIVDSITLVEEVSPRSFVFENVPRFLSTACTDTDGVERTIEAAIDRNLSAKYSIYSRVVNFKDFGASSSRSRTIVIGVRKDLANQVSPIDLFPDYKTEVLLWEAIGHLPPLAEMGQIDPKDIFHSFRSYPVHMENWINKLLEGQSAFDNQNPEERPHKVVEGEIIPNVQKNGDKYRRQLWDKVGPCVHTRNDQLASQNTIHPRENRVFSIRELMNMMTVPSEFKWTMHTLEELNELSEQDKRAYLKKNEMNIRQSLGEAVPTAIFRAIASNYKKFFSQVYLKDSQIRSLIAAEELHEVRNLKVFLKDNSHGLGYSTLCRIVELSNSKRHEQEAYFTNKSLVTEIVKRLPNHKSDEISILEPSVGAGNFIPELIKHYGSKRQISLTLNDIDPDSMVLLKALLENLSLPKSVSIEFTLGDHLLQEIRDKYDLVIGNPPFSKSTPSDLLGEYRAVAHNKRAINSAAFFIEKAIKVGKYVAMVLPKSVLNTPEFGETRNLLMRKKIDHILDFGESGFKGVLIESIAILINPTAKPSFTRVRSLKENLERKTQQAYITDDEFPYWLIYRNEHFDKTAAKLKLGVFEVFRDRQITTKMLSGQGDIRVIKSRNIGDDGSSILNIDNYDAFISKETSKTLAVQKFLNRDDVYLTPNMTYKPRVIPKPIGTLVNGSAAILILKSEEETLTDEQIRFFSTYEYREFYKVARNYQTRSLNVDANSVFFFGKLIR